MLENNSIFSPGKSHLFRSPYETASRGEKLLRGEEASADVVVKTNGCVDSDCRCEMSDGADGHLDDFAGVIGEKTRGTFPLKKKSIAHIHAFIEKNKKQTVCETDTSIFHIPPLAS